MIIKSITTPNSPRALKVVKKQVHHPVAALENLSKEGSMDAGGNKLFDPNSLLNQVKIALMEDHQQ